MHAPIGKNIDEACQCRYDIYIQQASMLVQYKSVIFLDVKLKSYNNTM